MPACPRATDRSRAWVCTRARRRIREIRGVYERTMEMLQRYSWPGNIRELQNVIERWAVICDSEDISMEESWLPRDPAPPSPEAVPESLPDDSVDLPKHIEQLERKLIGRAMTAVGGNQSEAARRLGMSRGSLIERLKRYGLSQGNRRWHADAALPLGPGSGVYPLALAIVVLSTWYGGRGPGWIALIISIAGVRYFFIEPK